VGKASERSHSLRTLSQPATHQHLNAAPIKVTAQRSTRLARHRSAKQNARAVYLNNTATVIAHDSAWKILKPNRSNFTRQADQQHRRIAIFDQRDPLNRLIRAPCPERFKPIAE